MGVHKGILVVEGHDRHVLGGADKAVRHQHSLQSALSVKACPGALALDPSRKALHPASLLEDTKQAGSY